MTAKSQNSKTYLKNINKGSLKIIELVIRIKRTPTCPEYIQLIYMLLAEKRRQKYKNLKSHNSSFNILVYLNPAYVYYTLVIQSLNYFRSQQHITHATLNTIVNSYEDVNA
jgi:hypothetical protein